MYRSNFLLCRPLPVVLTFSARQLKEILQSVPQFAACLAHSRSRPEEKHCTAVSGGKAACSDPNVRGLPAATALLDCRNSLQPSLRLNLKRGRHDRPDDARWGQQAGLLHDPQSGREDLGDQLQQRELRDEARRLDREW